MALEGVSVRVATVSNKGFYDRGLSDLLESGLGGFIALNNYRVLEE